METSEAIHNLNSPKFTGMSVAFVLRHPTVDEAGAVAGARDSQGGSSIDSIFSVPGEYTIYGSRRGSESLCRRYTVITYAA